MRTKLLTTLIAALLALSAWANGTEIDGIYYELDSSTKTASVTYTGTYDYNPSSTAYKGDVTIPATITDPADGETYSVTSIGDYAFESCRGLTSITIPESVTTTGNWAFEGCTSLTSITIPNSVTSIGIEAFSGCTSLTSIKVAAGNTEYDSRDNCNAIIETASNTLVAGCKATIIPSSVTSIGCGAFNGCKGLTSITIPSSVTRIVNYAFYKCTGLTSITIPSSVTSIGEGAFSGCTGLTSIKVEAGNTKYDSRDNCNAIIETASNTLVVGCKATIIPSSVTSIGSHAFYDCTGLTSITIPNSVTTIGDLAFTGCTGLTSITIPNSVTTIGAGAFSGCTGLTSITIPNSVTSISSYAFEDCKGLTSITIPNSVTTIGDYAFYRCTGLTSITIPESVTSIGEWAFYGCTGLTSITIPESVTSIREVAFYRCTGLTDIYAMRTAPAAYDCEREAFSDYSATLHVPAGSKEAYASTEPWSNFANIVEDIDTGSDDAVVLTADGEDVWTDGVLRFSVSSEENGEAAVSGVKDKDNLGAVTIPEKVKIADKIYYVTSIWEYAFKYCTGLTSITIPNSVTSIGDEAFHYCTGLTSITIPESVTSIGEKAFFYCTGLTSVTIPNSVTTIGANAFRGCTGLTSITIPSSVTWIGGGAFAGCSGLTSIKVEAGNTKYDSRDNCNAIIETASNTLVVGCMATTIPSSVTSIGEDAFYNCTSLTGITIPNSVTSIGDWAFADCTDLTSITIPNSVTTIGANTFEGCTGLTSINIPNSVTSIGEKAFRSCTGLTSITIPSSVTWIGGGAFAGCSGLTSIKVEAGNTKYDSRDNCNAIIETASNTLVVGCMATTIPSSVTSIGDGAFIGCTSLTGITIPNSVIRIGDYAFYYCTDLTSITIPNSVTRIGDYAFYYCTGLEDIYALRTDPAAYDCATDAFSDYSATLHVPAGSKEAYAGTAPWSNFDNIVEDIDTGSDDAVVLTADGEDVWTDGVLRFSVSSEENGEAVVSGVKDKDNLGAVTIPEKVKIADKVYSVTSIGEWAFYGCTGLTSVTIPNSVTSIGDWAFGGCTGLTSITIPESVTSIGQYAFQICTSLTSITIPNSVTSIGWAAFFGCTGLTSITIPNSVTTIGSGAFAYCIGLTSIKVAAGNTKYDSRDNCNAIIETASNTLVVGCKATIIPSSVTSIGNYAFYACTSLTSITIPNSVTTIGDWAFAGCTGLTSITIPNSVTTIGDWAFAGCIGLTSIKVAAGNTKYDSRDNCNAIIETASNTLVVGCKATIIPSSVTSIGNYAFYECTGLTSITIPNSVTSIGDQAFRGCTDLTSITIPNSVTSIGKGAFAYCTGLTSITIPNSVTSIGQYAFYDCTGLTDIYALRTDPEAYNCDTDAFEDVPTSTCTLHVPKGSKEAYKAIKPWSNFANIVEEEDLTAIQSLTLTPSEASESYYNLQGQRIAEPQRGQLVIVRYSDGSSRKMYVR